MYPRCPPLLTEPFTRNPVFCHHPSFPLFSRPSLVSASLERVFSPCVAWRVSSFILQPSVRRPRRRPPTSPSAFLPSFRSFKFSSPPSPLYVLPLDPCCFPKVVSSYIRFAVSLIFYLVPPFDSASPPVNRSEISSPPKHYFYPRKR